MNASSSRSIEQYVADCLSHAREELARTWVERVATELHIRPRRVLPEQDLLDSMPAILLRVAEFLRTGKPDTLTADATVTKALRELTRWRRSQGCDPQELLRELDLLAQVLDGACLSWLGSYRGEPNPEAIVRVAGRLNRAPILIGEIAIGAYREADAEERSNVRTRLQEFTQTLAHELNTPLAGAEMAALMLESDESVTSAQERRRFAGLIQRNLRRARHVISDVREVTLAETGAGTGGRWVSLKSALDEVLLEVRDQARSAGVRIEVAEPIPDWRVDAVRIEIVLLNLLRNAAKYSDASRPARWVRIGFEPGEEGGICISVSDNGLGIPEKQHPHVFQRFVRLHPEHADGSGLGLAIAREATQQLGGRIELESEPGEGSCFRIHLPPPPSESVGAQEGRSPDGDGGLEENRPPPLQPSDSPINSASAGTGDSSTSPATPD